MVVLQLFEFCTAVVFTFWYTDAGRADVCVSVLMILMLVVALVEKELCVYSFGLSVGVWCDL